MTGIRGSFHTQYEGNTLCPQKDTQEQFLCCPALVAHLSNSEQELLEQAEYSDICGTLQELKDVTGIFLILLGIRTRLLNKDVGPAYEGKNSPPIT